MVQPLGIAAYHQQLMKLLPQGKAWTRDPNTVLSRLMRAEAANLAEIDRIAVKLLDELLPQLTFDLLPEWEASLGLPDDCTDLAATVSDRRAALIQKIVSRLDTNPDTYVRIGREFGVDITVSEQDEARAGEDSSYDTAGGRWRHVWWIEIPSATPPRRFNTLSDVMMPLLVVDRNVELECRLQAAAPAHTELLVEYTE